MKRIKIASQLLTRVSSSQLIKYVGKYLNHFKSKTKDQHSNLLLYFKGLFQGKKRNIERMGESVKDSEYYALQHFISEAPWNHSAVID